MNRRSFGRFGAGDDRGYSTGRNFFTQAITQRPPRSPRRGRVINRSKGHRTGRPPHQFRPLGTIRIRNTGGRLLHQANGQNSQGHRGRHGRRAGRQGGVARVFCPRLLLVLQQTFPSVTQLNAGHFARIARPISTKVGHRHRTSGPCDHALLGNNISNIFRHNN